jgi:Tol biopolymer transport system component
VIGSSLKKIRDDAHDAGLSPDGAQIAFTNVDDDEIWIMNSDGSQAHQFLKADPEFHLYGPTFINHGKRILYVKQHTAGGDIKNIVESRNLGGDDAVTLIDNPSLFDATMNQPGRVIYSVSEPPPHERDSNLWDIYYDPETGRPKGAPRRLTDWTGFTFLNPSISTDGKNFTFLNQRDQAAVYVGELAANGDELKSPQRLTLNENYSWPTGWSADGKTVLFYSNRNGNFDIYRQGVGERTAEAVSTSPEDKWWPQLSPDGKWVLYMQFTKSSTANAVKSGKMMRVSVAGGAPEFVMDINGAHSGPQPTALSTLVGLPAFRCARQPGAPCVIAERKDNQVVFSTFDPLQGRKAEVVKQPPKRGTFDISPDGSRIAWTTFSYTKGEVEIIPLDGSAHQKISGAPWTEFTNVVWAPDGKSLFLNSFSSRGSAILHLNLDGTSKMLYKPGSEIFALTVSPDGKYLAFGPAIYDSNAWTMGSFPAK